MTLYSSWLAIAYSLILVTSTGLQQLCVSSIVPLSSIVLTEVIFDVYYASYFDSVLPVVQFQHTTKTYNQYLKHTTITCSQLRYRRSSLALASKHMWSVAMVTEGKFVEGRRVRQRMAWMT